MVIRKMPLIGSVGSAYTELEVKDFRARLTRENFDSPAMADDIANMVKQSSTYVRITDIVVGDYQRHSDEYERSMAMNAMIKMAREWEPNAFQVPTMGMVKAGPDMEEFASNVEPVVSHIKFPKGLLTMGLDGGHRAAFAHMVGATHIAVNLVHVREEDEAGLYHRINAGHKAVSSHSKARAVAQMSDGSLEGDLIAILAKHGRSMTKRHLGGPVMAMNMMKWLDPVDPEAFARGVESFLYLWPEETILPEIAGALGWFYANDHIGLNVTNAKVNPRGLDAKVLDCLKSWTDDPSWLLKQCSPPSGHAHGRERVKIIVEKMLSERIHKKTNLRFNYSAFEF